MEDPAPSYAPSSPISSPQPPPAYPTDFNQLYQQWSLSLKSANELDSLKDEIDKTQKELNNAESELSKLKKASSSLFETLHSKKNPFSSLLASKSERQEERERRELAKKDFERAHSDETKLASSVEALKTRLSQMEQNKEALNASALLSNELWSRLNETPEAQLALMGPSATIIGEKLEGISSSESLLKVLSEMTANLTRGRQSIQHTHHYFSLALRATDDLKPATSGSRIVEGFAGDMANMSRQNEYRDAISQANKAQVCLDEFFRVTDQYLYIFPEDRTDDYNALKKDGVKQVAKIYDLLYSGSSSSISVRKSVQELVEKQETVFGYLTRLAVFIQEKAPACESEEKTARMTRDEARNELASIWRGGQVPHGLC